MPCVLYQPLLRISRIYPIPLPTLAIAAETKTRPVTGCKQLDGSVAQWSLAFISWPGTSVYRNIKYSGNLLRTQVCMKWGKGVTVTGLLLTFER